MKKSDETGIRTYEDLKLLAARHMERGRLESALDYLYVAATYAARVNVGIFCDPDIEQMLAEIGRVILGGVDGSGAVVGALGNIRRVGHITSFASDVGGHTATLRQWTDILKDLVETQFLYVTNVSNRPKRHSSIGAFEQSGVIVREFQCEGSYVDRIKNLVGLLRQDKLDLLVSYVSLNDVIAVSALAALDDRPFVAFYNHADHLFWLGRDILDLLIEFRSTSTEYSARYRGIDNPFVIPLTTNVSARPTLKSEFGVPSHATLSISVGNVYRLRGDPDMNLVRVIGRILESFPDHYHLLVTDVSAEEILGETVSASVGERFIVTGPLVDLSPVYGAGDFLIETIPLPGGTVKIEAMACELPVVGFENPYQPMLTKTGYFPGDYKYVASSEDEIVELSAELICSPEARRAAAAQLHGHFNQAMSRTIVRGLWESILQDPGGMKSHVADGDASQFKDDAQRAQVLSERYAPVHQDPARFPLYNILLKQAGRKLSGFTLFDRLGFYLKGIRSGQVSPRVLPDRVLFCGLKSRMRAGRGAKSQP
jgi:hypothetical protein